MCRAPARYEHLVPVSSSQVRSGRGPHRRSVVVGQTLGPISRTFTEMDLLRYASGSRDLNLIHHDREHARRFGLQDTIVQGSLKSAVLSQMLVEWLEDHGSLAELAVEYRGVDLPGDVLTGRGLVTSAYANAAGDWVEIDVWLENAAGARNTRGRALCIWDGDGQAGKRPRA
jgi:acyl dehydratase